MQAPADLLERPLEHGAVEGRFSATPHAGSPIDGPMRPSETVYATESYTQPQQFEETSPLHNAAAIAYPPSAQNQQIPDQYASPPTYYNAATSSPSVQQAANLYHGPVTYPEGSSSYSGGETTFATAHPPAFSQAPPEQQYQQEHTQQQLATLFEQYQQYEATLQFNAQPANWNTGGYQAAQGYQYTWQAPFSEAAQYAVPVDPSSSMYPPAHGYQNSEDTSSSATPQYPMPVESSPGFHQDAYRNQYAAASQYAEPVNSNPGMYQDVPGNQDATGASFSEASQYDLLMNTPIESDQAGGFASQHQQQQIAEQPQAYTAEEIAYLNQLNAVQQHTPAPVPQQQYEQVVPGTTAAEQQHFDYVHAPFAMQTELAPRLVQPVYRLPVEDDSPVLPAAEPFLFGFDLPDGFTLQDAQDALVAQAIAEDAPLNIDLNDIDPNLLSILFGTPVDGNIIPTDFDWSQLPLPPLGAAPPNAAAGHVAQIDPALAPFNLPPPDATETEEELERSLDFLVNVVATYQSDSKPLSARFDLPALGPQGGPLNLAGAAANAEFAQRQTQRIIFGERGRQQFESAYEDVYNPANPLAGPSSQPYFQAAFGESSHRKRRASVDEDEDDAETGRNKSSRLSANQDATKALSPPAPVSEPATPPAMEPELVDRSLPADLADASSNPSASEQEVEAHSGPGTPAAELSTTPVLEAEGDASEIKLGKRSSPDNDNLDSGRHKRTRSKPDQDVTQAHSPPPATPAEPPASPSPTPEPSVRQLSAKARGKRRALTAADDEKDQIRTRRSRARATRR